jgi:hypothetical protein
MGIEGRQCDFALSQTSDVVIAIAGFDLYESNALRADRDSSIRKRTRIRIARGLTLLFSFYVPAAAGRLISRLD